MIQRYHSPTRNMSEYVRGEYAKVADLEAWLRDELRMRLIGVCEFANYSCHNSDVCDACNSRKAGIGDYRQSLAAELGIDLDASPEGKDGRDE